MNDERYQGLNLPQLLELVNDLVPPEAVSWLPQTKGWWVLLGWLLTILLLALVKWAQHRRRNRYRREALEMLARIDLQSNPQAAGQIATVVKRTALTAYPRHNVASLHGSEWARFLVHTSNNNTAVSKAAELLAEAAYKPNIAAADLVKPARRWIRVHRA